MVKHNNSVTSAHHRKWWQRHVKTWFNQPGRKERRQKTRQEKDIKSGITPRDSLRPIVRCPNQKYNFKVRAGRGFSLEELKAVKLSVLGARAIGVSVDQLRKNRSEEGMAINVKRLQAYLDNVQILPDSKGRFKIPGVPITTPGNIKGKRIANTIKEAFPIRNSRKALVGSAPAK